MTLKTEILTDPLGKGYAGMSPKQVIAAGNVVDRPNPDPPETLTAAEIWNAVKASEYTNLTAANRAKIDLISGMGDAVPVKAGLIKDTFFSVFGAGTVSRANLVKLTRPKVSRWRELRIPKPREGDILTARRG